MVFVQYLQINSSGIVRKAKHDLRRSVPSRSYIFSHETRILRAWIHVETSCETEIANLQFTAGQSDQGR